MTSNPHAWNLTDLAAVPDRYVLVPVKQVAGPRLRTDMVEPAALDDVQVRIITAGVGVGNVPVVLILLPAGKAALGIEIGLRLQNRFHAFGEHLADKILGRIGKRPAQRRRYAKVSLGANQSGNCPARRGIFSPLTQQFPHGLFNNKRVGSGRDAGHYLTIRG